MRILRAIGVRLRSMFRLGQRQTELDEEIQTHLELRVDELVEQGATDADARCQARREFGHMDSAKEATRDSWGTAGVQNLLRDLRLSFRSLRKSPGFTAIALLTLALGIGVNTSMFSVLNALLFHQAPYVEPDRLIRVYRTTPTMQFGPHSPANFVDLQAQTQSFDHVAAYARTSANLAEPDQPATQLSLLAVSGEFFATLGVSPALGRAIATADDRPGHDDVIVLSHAFWQQHFAGDPQIVGRSIRLDSQPITVIGVMPENFEDPLLWGQISGWKPLSFDADDLNSRGSNWLSMIGRLAPDSTMPEALAELNTHFAALARVYPETNAESGTNLVPFVRSTQDKTVRLVILFAMGLAICVLLIACVNLANLFFARNLLRGREHAIRSALGATRRRLIWNSLAESLLLAVAGGGLGLLVAVWVNHALGSHAFWSNPASAPSIDWTITGFAFAAALLASAIFGLLPAVMSSRTDVNGALKQAGRGSTSSSHSRLRHGLIIAEVALALMLLAGAGFFVRGLQLFADRDNGWQTENLLTARLSLSETRYPNNASVVAFYERLETRLSALPGVVRHSFSRTLPFTGFSWGQYYIVEGDAPLQPGTEPMRDLNLVSPDYFATMGIRVVEGRPFQPTDATGPRPTIISESMARNLWPGESAVGKRITHPRTPDDWQEIVGVVRDVRFPANLDSSGERFQTYRLLAGEPEHSISIALQCAIPPEALIDSLREVVADLDPELPVVDTRPARQVVQENTANFALIGKVLIGFAALGLALATIGLYGVVSGNVAQRTNELGIRTALGAQWRDVIRLVLGQGFRLTMIGTFIGLLGTWWISKLLQSLLPALPSSEPHLTGAIAVLLLLTTLVACWFPARRAARINPIEALRTD